MQLDSKIKRNVRSFYACQRLSIHICLDVNSDIYWEFYLAKNNLTFFQILEVSIIQLDEDFGGSIEAELTQNILDMWIEINASLRMKIIKNIIDKKVIYFVNVK